MTSYTYDVEHGTVSGDTRNKGSAASLNHVSGPLIVYFVVSESCRRAILERGRYLVHACVYRKHGIGGRKRCFIVYYFLGDFDAKTGKFTPDEHFDNNPALLDYGCNVFTGPSVFVDPQSGDTCVFSIMQDQRTGAEECSTSYV